MNKNTKKQVNNFDNFLRISTSILGVSGMLYVIFFSTEENFNQIGTLGGCLFLLYFFLNYLRGEQ